MSSQCVKGVIEAAWPSSAGRQVHGNAQQILQRQLEVHDLLKAGAGGQFHQQIEVTARPVSSVLKWFSGRLIQPCKLEQALLQALRCSHPSANDVAVVHITVLRWELVLQER